MNDSILNENSQQTRHTKTSRLERRGKASLHPQRQEDKTLSAENRLYLQLQSTKGNCTPFELKTRRSATHYKYYNALTNVKITVVYKDRVKTPAKLSVFY